MSLVSGTWSPYKGRPACRHTAGKPLTAFQKIFPAGAWKDLLGQVPVWARKLLSQDDMFMAILVGAGLNPHPPVLACALLSGVAFQLNHGILPDAFYEKASPLSSLQARSVKQLSSLVPRAPVFNSAQHLIKQNKPLEKSVPGLTSTLTKILPCRE